MVWVFAAGGGWGVGSKFRLTWALMPKEESKFICGDVVYLGREEIWAVSVLRLALMAVSVFV